MPERFDQSVVNETVLQTGNMVGDLAMSFFGEFTEVPYSQDKFEMIKITQRLLEAGVPVITEASFSYDDNFCMVDILRAVNSGYELIEVKGSTSSPGSGVDKVRPIYLHDMAYQAYVLTHCGVRLKKVSIMQLNREYVRRGELDIHELFVITDCTGLEVRQKSSPQLGCAKRLRRKSVQWLQSIRQNELETYFKKFAEDIGNENSDEDKARRKAFLGEVKKKTKMIIELVK